VAEKGEELDPKATKTFLNRVEASLHIAQKIQTADVNGDGNIDQNDFVLFKSVVTKVTEDPETLQQVIQEVENIVSGEQEQGQVFVLSDKLDTIVGTESDDVIRGIRDESGGIQLGPRQTP